MVRGRQKAKHMRVARKLKYQSPETDLDALAKELGVSNNDNQKNVDEWDQDEWESEDSSTPSYPAAWPEDDRG